MRPESHNYRFIGQQQFCISLLCFKIFFFIIIYFNYKTNVDSDNNMRDCDLRLSFNKYILS